MNRKLIVMDIEIRVALRKIPSEYCVVCVRKSLQLLECSTEKKWSWSVYRKSLKSLLLLLLLFGHFVGGCLNEWAAEIFEAVSLHLHIDAGFYVKCFVFDVAYDVRCLPLSGCLCHSFWLLSRFVLPLLGLVSLCRRLSYLVLRESSQDINFAAFALLSDRLGACLQQVDRLAFVFCAHTSQNNSVSDEYRHLREMKGIEFSCSHHLSEISIVSMARACTSDELRCI